MNELEDKNLDSFIWSSTYERYEKNILKDKEDKRLGQWNIDEKKIKNLKYSYVFLKDTGGLIVKKYTIKELFKSGFNKDFNDPNKWCFTFSESKDFFAEYPSVVQGRQYGNSLELDNLKTLTDSEFRARMDQSKNKRSPEGKKKPKTSEINNPVLNELRKLFNEKYKDKKPPNTEIVKGWVARYEQGEDLETIVNSFSLKKN